MCWRGCILIQEEGVSVLEVVHSTLRGDQYVGGGAFRFKRRGQCVGGSIQDKNLINNNYK